MKMERVFTKRLSANENIKCLLVWLRYYEQYIYRYDKTWRNNYTGSVKSVYVLRPCSWYFYHPFWNMCEARKRRKKSLLGEERKVLFWDFLGHYSMKGDNVPRKRKAEKDFLCELPFFLLFCERKSVVASLACLLETFNDIPQVARAV